MNNDILLKMSDIGAKLTSMIVGEVQRLMATFEFKNKFSRTNFDRWLKENHSVECTVECTVECCYGHEPEIILDVILAEEEYERNKRIPT